MTHPTCSGFESILEERLSWKINKVNYITLHYYIFEIFQYFTTKLHNFTKFKKLFPIVLKLFSNLKVYLIGEWSNDCRSTTQFQQIHTVRGKYNGH